MATVQIYPELERIKDMVTVDELMGIQEGSIREIRNVLARFVIDEKGQYVPEEEGLQSLGKLTIRQLEEVAVEFRKGMEGAAVPPKIEGDSD